MKMFRGYPIPDSLCVIFFWESGYHLSYPPNSLEIHYNNYSKQNQGSCDTNSDKPPLIMKGCRQQSGKMGQASVIALHDPIRVADNHFR